MSKRVHALSLLFSFGLFGTFGLSASTLSKYFILTTTEPIIAGQSVLPPGVYKWKLFEFPANRNLVQITNQKTGHVETTLLTIPTYRDKVRQKNQVTFWETPTGYPRAVHSWFLPGDNYGQELAYPAKLLATLHPLPQHQVVATNLSVVAAPPTTPVFSAHQHLPHLTAALRHPPVEPQGSWAVITDGPPASPQQAFSPKHQTRFWDKLRNLPLTATLAPLVGLIGIVCLTLYFLGNFSKKRIAKSS